ncbi:hypothetical protein BANRA_04655 [Escherichia coli]|nr:hypothetical protein BANRA_04655 [Escherichia coli]
MLIVCFFVNAGVIIQTCFQKTFHIIHTKQQLKILSQDYLSKQNQDYQSDFVEVL